MFVTLVFERQSGTKDWRIVGPRSLRAESSLLSNLVHQVYEAEAEPDRKPEGRAQAGLEPPLVEARVAGRSEKGGPAVVVGPVDRPALASEVGAHLRADQAR